MLKIIKKIVFELSLIYFKKLENLDYHLIFQYLKFKLDLTILIKKLLF